MRSRYFAKAVFNYPTLGEVEKYAAFDALARQRDTREGKVTPIDRAASK